MYNDKVTEAQISTLERKTGLRLIRYEAASVESLVHDIEKEFKKNEKEPRLNAEMLGFMRNEILLSQYDYKYWLKYCKIEYDGCEGGGIGVFNLWEAQKIVLAVIEAAEFEAYDHYCRKEPTGGIRLMDHKSRQLGGTAFGGSLLMHRVTLWKGSRAVAGSIDNEKVQELYDRHKIIYDNLPIWLKPSLDPKSGSYDVKAGHIQFGSLKSRILYQDSKQTSGVGQGRQFDLAQITECSSWDDPSYDIEFSLFPTLPQNWMTLAFLESQANGRTGWWPEITERCRKGKLMFWTYVFVPWYAEPKKYRAFPPATWKPSQSTLNHAFRVYETSPEFMGRKVILGREQLFWYESTRENYLASDRLNLFLTNYAATPQESFQHSTQSAFSTKTLEALDFGIKKGHAYEVLTEAVQ